MKFDASLEDRLIDGLGQLNIDASPMQVRQLLAYLALLVKWNQVYNLTAVRDPRDMLVVHLLDALSILPSMDARVGRSVIDVGSGAGLPAIPLAIMRDWAIWSVDAVAKKISFQVQVKSSLGLAGLHPIHSRIETLAIDQPVSVIISRAFSDLDKMLTDVDRLAGPDTTVIAMKGVVPTAEIAALPEGWQVREVVPLQVPFLGAERCAVVVQRASQAATAER